MLNSLLACQRVYRKGLMKFCLRDLRVNVATQRSLVDNDHQEVSAWRSYNPRQISS